MENKTITNNRSRIDILLEEYRSLVTLFNTSVPDYKQQISHLGIYATIFGGLLIYVFSGNFDQHSDEISYQIFAITLLLISMFILYYLITNLLDTLAHMYYIEFRINAIERLVNHELGEDLLIWESKIITSIHDVKFSHYKVWINTAYTYAACLFVIECGLTFLHWMLCYKYAPGFLTFYVDITAFCSLFLVYQAYLFNFKAAPHIHNIVMELSGLKEFKKKSGKEYSLFIVPLITIIIGWLSFMTMGLTDQVLISNPADNIKGIISIPSVFIGDLILLPLFNYWFFDLLLNKVTVKKIKENKPAFLNALIISSIISIAINTTTHMFWINDKYVDFISDNNATLSFSGWWHLIFSTIQMTLIGLFLYTGVFIFRNKLVDEFLFCKRLYWFLLLFSLLSLLDFSMIYFQFNISVPFFKYFFRQPLNFLSPAIAILLLLTYYILRSKVKQKKTVGRDL